MPNINQLKRKLPLSEFRLFRTKENESHCPAYFIWELFLASSFL